MHVYLSKLPFLLEEFVSKDDIFYNFLLELSNIVHISYSPVLSSGTCGYLEDLIRAHYQSFKQIFPEEHLIPKHHYLLEIPKLVPIFGPPVRYSYMRFEAMHKVFKSFAAIVNYSSLCLALSERYLKYICEENVGEDNAEHSLVQSKRIDGPGNTLTRSDIERYNVTFPDVSIWNDIVYSLNWVISCGTKYVAQKCVVAVDAERYPSSHIWIINKDFVC